SSNRRIPIDSNRVIPTSSNKEFLHLATCILYGRRAQDDAPIPRAACRADPFLAPIHSLRKWAPSKIRLVSKIDHALAHLALISQLCKKRPQSSCSWRKNPLVSPFPIDDVKQWLAGEIALEIFTKHLKSLC